MLNIVHISIDVNRSLMYNLVNMYLYEIYNVTIIYRRVDQIERLNALDIDTDLLLILPTWRKEWIVVLYK